MCSPTNPSEATRRDFGVPSSGADFLGVIMIRRVEAVCDNIAGGVTELVNRERNYDAQILKRGLRCACMIQRIAAVCLGMSRQNVWQHCPPP